MIGLQDLVINNNIKIPELAKEININPSEIWRWFRNNKIPNRRLGQLSEIFNVNEEYLNKQVNDISTYRPKVKGFNDYEIREDITAIFLRKRDGRIFETIIDTKNLERIKNLGIGWNAAWIKSVDKYYVKSSEYVGNGQFGITRYLHIEIMQVSNEYVVDHKNNDRLDNREENLRITKQLLNTKNRTSKNKNNTSGFRNVFWSTKDERWLVVLQIEKKSKCFGRFKFNDLAKAGILAEEMRQKYYGKFAGNN